MAAHLAAGESPRRIEGCGHSCAPDASARPGLLAGGALVGFASGNCNAVTLRALAMEADGLRLTPWRMIFVEGLCDHAAGGGLVTEADDPLLRVIACSGRRPAGKRMRRPARLQQNSRPAFRPTAALHVSGCAKGCAHPGAARRSRWSPQRMASTRSAMVRRATRRSCAGSTADQILADPSLLGRPADAARYETDGAAIYRQSFATIRAEANLARFTADEEPVVVRMIHAAGMVGLEHHVRFTPGMARLARAALQDGAPILCDARMVSEGITRARLPAGNAVICTLNDPAVAALALAMGNTRSPPRWSCGGRISPAPSSPSAMRRPRYFIS